MATFDFPRLDSLSADQKRDWFSRFVGADIAAPALHSVDPHDLRRLCQQEVWGNAEYFYITQSAAASSEQYVFVSLGASPGEWAVMAYQVYKHLHPGGSFHSLSLEGDASHVERIREHHRKSGLPSSSNITRHAVVAAKDGFAKFPVVNPAADYGAAIAGFAEAIEELDSHITITETTRAHHQAVNSGKPLELQTVEALSLPTLLATFPLVDFIHADIQGAEVSVFSPHTDTLNEKVGMCCIETHGRNIEQELLKTFSDAGWSTLLHYPCHLDEQGQLTMDGHVIFANPAFTRTRGNA